MEFASTPPYDGTLCKYYLIPEDFCYKLPEHVSLEEGALMEPMAVAVHIVRQAGVRPGDKVVVFGAGPVGCVCAGVAGAYGAATVVVVDIQEKRAKFAGEWVKSAKKVGVFIPGKGASVEESAKRLIEENELGEGADVSIDASGAEASVTTGIEVLRRGGTYVQGGMGKPVINFPILKVGAKEITVKGSFRYAEGDYKVAVELVGQGKIDVKGLITGKVAFEEAEKAFGSVRRGEGIKMLIEGVKD
jgi:D-xylulose reductase